MKKKIYTEKDLMVRTYGRGHDKRFAMYTDFNPKTSKWNKVVYPDIDGNKKLATGQALRWLNSSGSKRYNIFEGETKVSLVYDGPSCFCETDNDGNFIF